MKILQTVVSREGFKNARANRKRLKLLLELLDIAAGEACDFVLLPAGYLMVSSGSALSSTLDEVQRMAENKKVGIIGGIDVGRLNKSALDHRVQKGRDLPFCGFAFGPGTGAPRQWWQRTFLSEHVTPDNAIDISGRTIMIGGRRVLVVLCGEMFNHWMRQALAESAGSIDLIVDAAHASLGQGLISTLRSMARNARCPVMLSQHLKSTGGKLHLVHGDERQDSKRAGDHLQDTGLDLWASAVVRTIP